MKRLNKEENYSTFELAKKIISNMQLLGGATYCDRILNHHSFSIAAYGKDERIFSRNEFRRSVAIVLEGTATVRKNYSGCDLVIRTLEPGDFFGIAALFGEDHTYVSEIVSDKGCVVAFVAQEIVESLFRVCPDAAIAYITVLSQKIRYLNRKIDNFTAPSALAKLALYLYENRRLTISMQSLAERLGMTRMTLYRSFHILTENRCISKNGKTIEVTNPDALLQYATPGEII